MAKWLYSLGTFAARKAWAVIAIWVLVIAGVGTSYAAFHGQLKNTFTMPGTETQQLSDELASRLPDANRGVGQVVITTGDGSKITEQQQQAFVSTLNSLKNETSSVDAVTDPFETTKDFDNKEKQLKDAQREIEQAPQKITDGKKQLKEGQRKIDEGKKQLESARGQLDQSQGQLNDGKKQLEDSQKQLNNALAQAQASGASTTVASLNAQQEQLNAKRNELNTKQGQVDGGRAELETKKKELEKGQKELNDKKAEVTKAEQELPANKEKVARGQALIDLVRDYRLISEDGSTAISTVYFTQKAPEVLPADKEKIMEHFKNADLKGLQVSFDQNIAESPGGGMGPGEIVGMAVALIVLLVMLGTLIAAGLPILNALVGVVVGVLATLSFSSVIDMSSTTYILGMMLGLAVGIDYSLFIINRHRANLMAGMNMRTSIALANGTSGNAVVFAGATVVIALLALNVTGIPFLGYMGDAGALCVAIAVLISVTLTPALLSLVGTKVMSKKLWAKVDTPEKIARYQQEQQEREASPHGWLKMVLSHPVATIAASVLILGAIAAPMAQMRLGLPDASTSPVESTEYKSYEIIKDKFGEGMSAPVIVATHMPAGMTAEQLEQAQIDIARAIKDKDSDNVKTVLPVANTDDRTLQVFQVTPTHGASSVPTERLVEELREVTVPVQGEEVRLGVTGATGGNIDVSKILGEKLPLYLAVVMGLSFLVLILVFRSVMVPLVASVGFLFSILASFGAVVMIYQLGFMGPLFGVHNPGPILSFLPTLMVGILFGLAMDYQVFLVSGMREAYVHGKSARSAIISGYNHASRVVVAAMIIMASVFGGFMFAESVMIRPIGFGLAFGVLVDAFVVRMSITPAIMTLLGDKAWWMPKWLDRLVPNMDVEGVTLEESLKKELAAGQGTRVGAGQPASDEKAASNKAGDTGQNSVSTKKAVDSAPAQNEPYKEEDASGAAKKAKPRVMPWQKKRVADEKTANEPEQHPENTAEEKPAPVAVTEKKPAGQDPETAETSAAQEELDALREEAAKNAVPDPDTAEPAGEQQSKTVAPREQARQQSAQTHRKQAPEPAASRPEDSPKEAESAQTPQEPQQKPADAKDSAPQVEPWASQAGEAKSPKKKAKGAKKSAAKASGKSSKAKKGKKAKKSKKTK